jgi:hypothetical protein
MGHEPQPDGETRYLSSWAGEVPGAHNFINVRAGLLAHVLADSLRFLPTGQLAPGPFDINCHESAHRQRPEGKK